MKGYTSGTFGDYSAAKLDFLTAAALRIDPETGRRGGVGVNYLHCRPLHPHGYKMMREGLMRLERHPRGGNCFISVLIITDDGLKELARLKKRAAKRGRRHPRVRDAFDRTFMPQAKGTPTRRSRAASNRLTQAIAFSKAARRKAQA